MYCPRTTYVGSAGVGDGCVIGTHTRLLMVPLRVDTAVWNQSVTTTTWQLGDEPIGAALAKILSASDLTRDGLNATLESLAARVKATALGKLDEAKRVRVRTGWFSRGIYYSAKEKGPGWTGYPLKGKPLAQAWADFYRALPNFVS
ncbi:MAG: hypothetical protein R3A79_04420 [Nannocystaceae bacterium]